MDGGILSQDEINALLSGMDLSSNSGNSATSGDSASADPGELLTDVEKDAIGEVANISMGSSATTLYSLVNQKVNITTPVVTIANWDSVLAEYERPCVFIQIKYTEGLDGTNILVLKEHDVKVITDLMMGGDGTNTDGDLGELHLSAISEAMNQMMGAAATSLSTMLGKKIDISPPEASLIDFTQFKKPEDIAEFLTGNFVRIAFRMQIGDDLVDSMIMQLYPIKFAKSLYDTFIGSQTGEPEPAPAPEPEPTPAPEPTPTPMPQAGMNQQGMPQMGMPQTGMPQMGMPGAMPQMGMDAQMMGMNPQMMGMAGGYPQMGMSGGAPPMMQNPQMGMQGNPAQMPNVQPAQFQSFSGSYPTPQTPENIGLIMDVPLEVTVELGRTQKSISDILDFAPGTIIELDKIAGEPIDILVNGKFVAKGEVVVVEESFGVRVTEIIK